MCSIFPSYSKMTCMYMYVYIYIYMNNEYQNKDGLGIWENGPTNQGRRFFDVEAISLAKENRFN